MFEDTLTSRHRKAGQIAEAVELQLRKGFHPAGRVDDGLEDESAPAARPSTAERV